MAQAGEETYGLKSFHEYTYYRLSLLGTSKTYWSDKFNTTKNPTQDPEKKNPNDYADPQKPGYADGEKLLNYVYGENKTLGNTQMGDGWKYRGRGILQLTGRANYSDFNDFYRKNYDSSVNLLSHPEWLDDDKTIGVISGLWYFKTRILNHTLTAKTSVDDVTYWVNGGINGINKRKALYKKAQIDIRCH